MTSKGISYGSISVTPDGKIGASRLEGVDPDLRVRPFFAHGGTTSIREFVIGALNNEMGFQASDPKNSSRSGMAMRHTRGHGVGRRPRCG